MLEAIALPKESRPLRIGSNYSSDPTCAVSLYDDPDVNFSLVNGENTANLSDAQIFLFRSALRHAVVTYLPQYEATGTTSYTASQPVWPGGQVYPNQDEEILYFYPVAMQSMNPDNSALSPHGEFLYPGVLDSGESNRGFWCDVGTNIVFSVNGPVSGTWSVNIIIHLEQDGKWVKCGPVILLNATSTVISIQFVPTSFPLLPAPGPNGAGGYLSFSYQANDASSLLANADLTITYNWSQDGMGESVPVGLAQWTLPDLSDNIEAIDDLRVIGVAGMFTNTSAAVARQGQVAGLQCDAKTDFRDYLGYSAVTSDRRKHVAFENSEGMYGFLLPQDDNDFSFLDEIETGSQDIPTTGPTNLKDAKFMIVPRSAYITVCVSAQPGYNRTGYWTYSSTVEFTSQNQWYDLQKPEYSLSQLSAGAQCLKTCQQWHQNFPHIGEIWDWIKDAAKNVVGAIVDYGPTVLKGAAMVAPLLL